MDRQQLFGEWKRLRKAERSFQRRSQAKRIGGWQAAISKYVPDKLEGTLNTAFMKAFELVFDQGRTVIEKTYDQQKKKQEFQVDVYAAENSSSRKAVRAFGRKAGRAKRCNMAISAVEGVGLGLVGMGLPDIPVFLAVLLKGIYETALHYGFSYDTREEQMFILKVMETALLFGDEFMEADSQMNEWIERHFDMGDRQEQIQNTSRVLAQEMLYLKFVQGIPVVGVVGGISDVVYHKKILEYANLKYSRRFLLQNIG